MVVGFVPVIGRSGQMVLGPLTFVLWLMLMVKAFQGQRFKLPLVGDWAEKQA
jgi:uncharacterized membrane protein